MLDVVERAAGRARDRLEELAVDRVVADPDGRDRDAVRREPGDELHVVLGVAVRVPVGQEDHVPHPPSGGEEIPARDVDRVLEVGPAPVPEAGDLRRERRVARPGGQERPELVGLGVEGDRGDHVLRCELIQHRERGALRVLHLLAVGQVAARVAHAVGTVDEDVESDRLALRRLGALGRELDREDPRERAANVPRVAEEMPPAGGDERAASGDPAGDGGKRRVVELRSCHAVEHDGVVVAQRGRVRRETGRGDRLDLEAAARECRRHRRRVVLGDDEHVEGTRHADRGGDGAGRWQGRREEEPRLDEVLSAGGQPERCRHDAPPRRQVDRQGQHRPTVHAERERT